MSTLQFICAAIGIFIVVASMVLCYATLWAEPREEEEAQRWPVDYDTEHL